MSSKSAKKQAKAERQARRAKVARRERQRNLASLAVVAVVVLIGAGLVAYSLYQEQESERQAAADLEEMQSELAASEAALAEDLENREVACGARAPASAASEAAPSPRPSPEMALEEGVDYAAVIETSCGTLHMDLAEDRAPEAVNAFVALARDGFYDGLEIFRNATTIGALQTGSATNDAAYDVGFTLADELSSAEEDGYPPGAVALANSGPDTSGSQFFFVYNDTFDEAFADNRAYTRFATVTEGLDILEQIGAIETTGPAGETPTELVYLESVEVVENP